VIEMKPGWITVISEPYTASLTDYMAQVSADNPDVWFKFQSTTSMPNAGSKGASVDGVYASPPVTLNTGPLTNDEASTKALKIPKTTSSTPITTATIPTSAGWVDRGSYNSGTNYVANDCVYDANNVWYRAITSSTNQALSNGTYWEALLPDSAAYPVSLPTREPWTVECWVKYDLRLTRGLSAESWYWLQGNNSSSSFKWGLGWFDTIGGGSPGFRFNYDQFGSLFVSAYSSGTWTIDPLNWHHIAITNTGSSSASNGGTQRMYCDGVLHCERVNGAFTDGLATSAASAGQFYLGQAFTRHYPGSVGDLSVWSKKPTGSDTANIDIDQLAFYSRQLSEDRIMKHYQAAP